MHPILLLGIHALHHPYQAPAPTVATVGKYRIELRIPEDGLFAGEALDIEFRLADTTKRDPIEGLQGVADATVTATVTMPAMPGMPVVRPKVHREGVPGDYGVELFFPHGGEYKIALRLTPPGERPIFAAFKVAVADSAERKPRPAPYLLRLIDPPKAAGQVRLRLAIEDVKAGSRVRAFDVAHEKRIHLILVSKDLGWFAHEHPSQSADGSFLWEGSLPAGGDYLVFADVAPKDKGSMVLRAPLKLTGPAPAWTERLALRGSAKREGIAASLPTVRYPVGRSVSVEFRLRDTASGKPLGDLQPYLGAQGHLMIVHQDGNAFVHIHPSEEKAAPGVVRFSARFPRAGIYKAWAQFRRKGRVVTLPFVLEARS